MGNRMGGDDPVELLTEMMWWVRDRLGLRAIPDGALPPMIELVRALCPGVRDDD